MRTLSWFVPTFLSVALGVCAGQTANFSGSWHLNVEKSHWGSKPKPFSVVLVIEHNNPVLQYRGTVTHVNEDTRDFTFSAVSYTHLRAHETDSYLVCRLLLEKKT